jgi:hypothetical protein
MGLFVVLRIFVFIIKQEWDHSLSLSNDSLATRFLSTAWLDSYGISFYRGIVCGER